MRGGGEGDLSSLPWSTGEAPRDGLGLREQLRERVTGFMIGNREESEEQTNFANFDQRQQTDRATKTFVVAVSLFGRGAKESGWRTHSGAGAGDWRVELLEDGGAAEGSSRMASGKLRLDISSWKAGG